MYDLNIVYTRWQPFEVQILSFLYIFRKSFIFFDNTIYSYMLEPLLLFGEILTVSIDLVVVW